jgi:hypothetical protein
MKLLCIINRAVHMGLTTSYLCQQLFRVDPTLPRRVPYVTVSFGTPVLKLNFYTGVPKFKFLEVHVILNQSQDAM